YPGVEVHATIAGNILEGWYLRRDVSTLLLTLILIVLFPVILAYIISKLRRTYLSLAVFGGTFLFITLFFYYLYAQYDMLPSLLFPLLSLSLTYIVCEAYRNIIFEQKSKFYKKAFSTYVPPQVVSEILKDPDSLKLGGEKRYVSILFSDIRGFTSLSEKMPPEQLVALLNKYLTPMTEIIFKEKGTLDKYIGDAIMAIFNAPVDLPEHPKKACKVALAMIAKLSKVNMEWTSRGLPSIKIGIGLHCGEAVVGNMGAALRFDYTAIGDTVNTASRLEGMTKLYGVGILVSDDIYKNARDTFIFRELDLLRVKGKNRPIAVYELMEQGERASYLMNQFPKALIDYRKGKFKTAKTAFQSILSEFPDDSPSKLYIKRCEEYIAAPPSQGWDGVYTATTK
ncbi:MAG: adenylate/guanylate cyclase domain-containing protein, partial [Deltaproteobacteria bacterium]|nr:adenylate/guanylate cyclase domain-containing protein [Deltaproteobacteria bacterium]